MSREAAPVPATRRTAPATNSSLSTNTQQSLLINVIRTLTTSVSEAQRELEKTKLERGYKESGETVDRLIKEHQKDIEECLSAFKDVSTRISASRERIRNVRTSLHSCKNLLECRRNDLKKLWMESAQQRHIWDFMNRLEELRSVPVEVEALLQKGNYESAAACIQKAKLELRDLDTIEGLSQLRVRIEEAKDSLSSHIVERIVRSLVDEPFEKNMSELLSGISEERLAESEMLSALANRLKEHHPESLQSRIDTDVRALEMLDKEIRVIDRIGQLCATAIDKQIRATVSLIRLRSSTDEQHPPDNVLLAQLMKLIYRQMDSTRDAHVVLADRVHQPDVLAKFWRSCQTAVDQLVSEHVGLQVAASAKQSGGLESLKRIFRFDGTACAPLASSSNPTEDVRIRLEEIRHKQGVGGVRKGMGESIGGVIKGAGETFNASQSIYEMCSEVHHLLVNMEQHATRFAALWLLILTVYTSNMRHFYERATVFSSSPELDGSGGGVVRKKISAAWAADEDISRLLMSLPNWQLAAVDTPSPTGSQQSERETRERNERESEILIGNLAMQKGIDKAELVSDINDIRELAVLHENLRTLALQIRSLLASLPPSIYNKLKTCLVNVSDANQQMKSTPVLLAAGEYVSQIESMSATCLLMLHLELRVHCFYHLLPLARPKASHPTDNVDPEVNEVGRDMASFNSVLRELLPAPKLHYIFDGLGHLCAAIFIHSSQHMQRLSDAGKKRVCRNIWGVQQRLSQITGRREAELERARAFYELLSHDVKRILELVPEKRNLFSELELSFLLSLAVRSHPVLSSQPGASEEVLAQLQTILKP